jgi:3',5'-cyclic-nucleotide phosphodiesterase
LTKPTICLPAGTYTHKDYICLDAGTINAGIKAIEKNTFTVPAATVLQEYIKATLFHAHLDHVSGLIINSPADVAKQFMQQQNAWI